jgi:hypothetical protein
MDLDAATVGAWLDRWWIEAALGAVVLVGVATGARTGDPVRIAVAAALALAVVDRIRLRMDNHSLALAVSEVRDAGVSAARRETGTVVGDGARGESAEAGAREGGDGEGAEDGTRSAS